jgi:nucleotide-binding universal stress UspA family protein
MDKTETEKLLLAFDGSFHAMEAAKYVAGIPAFRRMKLTLFNVYSKIPEFYFDLEASTPLSSRMKEIHAWDHQQEKKLEEAAQKARLLMIENGFPDENIGVKLHERKKGVARDIIAESRKGYRAVVAGRKGVSRIKDLVMGSVAVKLLERIDFAPLLVVGRNANSDRVLLAMDSSQGSLKAADFASQILGDSGCEIEFTSVIRGEVDEYADAFRRFMEERFDEVSRFFIEAGMSRERIKTGIISGAQSRAATICQKAVEDKFGTIIVGRRGLSRVKEFFMGRVSNKVVSLTRDQAVWIVN